MNELEFLVERIPLVHPKELPIVIKNGIINNDIQLKTTRNPDVSDFNIILKALICGSSEYDSVNPLADSHEKHYRCFGWARGEDYSEFGFDFRNHYVNIENEYLKLKDISRCIDLINAEETLILGSMFTIQSITSLLEGCKYDENTETFTYADITFIPIEGLHQDFLFILDKKVKPIVALCDSNNKIINTYTPYRQSGSILHVSKKGDMIEKLNDWINTI